MGVLDNCRITWGTVLSRDGDGLEVMCRQLILDDHGLALGEPSARRLDVWTDGYSAVPEVAVGDDVAIHWGRLCGRLRPEQIEALADATTRQLAVTNQRLARLPANPQVSIR
jgi:hypothetical protein